jgi:putative colanic acid biosynthesis UDP-glucose lipid carrier transferase
MTSEGLAPTRQWGFASDARAALLVCLFTADTLVIACSGIVSYLIRIGSFSLPQPNWAHIILACLAFGNVMLIAGAYRFAALRHHRQHLTRVTGFWVLIMLMLIAIIYLSKLGDEFSRAWMLLWAVSGWLGLIGTRTLMWRIIRVLRARGQLVMRVAVVGHGLAAERCAQRLQEDEDDVQVVGAFEASDATDGGRGSRAHRDISELTRLAADMLIDEIVVAAPCNDIEELTAPLYELSTLAVDIKLYLDVGAPTKAGCAPSILVPIWQRPLAGLPTVFKRGMDIGVSAMLLALTLPLMGMIGALVKLDSPGPVLFRQPRFGFSKKPFSLYKFRSMRCEASDDPSAPQARRNDARVTRVGRFLRRTSLDELPQLINVLKGDMSLVGPRPHPTLLDDKFASLIDGYLSRHRVKPGITGWAQVNGLRGETDTLDKMERRLEYDLFYIDHWSPLLDLKILCKTLAVFVDQRNAY